MEKLVGNLLGSELVKSHFSQQSSILSTKFDCPVARQNFPLLVTVHDCERLANKMHLHKIPKKDVKGRFPTVGLHIKHGTSLLFIERLIKEVPEIIITIICRNIYWWFCR